MEKYLFCPPKVWSASAQVREIKTLSRSDEVDLLVADSLKKAAGTSDLDKTNWVVLAVGGYGRGQLAPFSDIDLAVIHNGLRQEDLKKLVQKLFYPLWDAKLTLGHTVKSLKESVAFAREDLHWLTSSLDARFLGGDKEFFDIFTTRMLDVAGRKNGRPFLKALITSSSERWRLFGHAGRLREPELKEGHGGLRDIHAVRWAAKVFGKSSEQSVRGLKGASDLELISAADVANLEKAEDFLWQLRGFLHDSAGKGLNRLTFGFQGEIAEKFFPDEKEALTLFGRLLYKSTRDVSRIISSFFEEVAARCLKKKAVFSVGKKRFESRREELTFDSLLPILGQGRLSLEELEDLGIEGDLASLITGWRNITGLASADANHMHPVDTHSFYTVVEMVDIAVGKGASVDRPMATEIYKEIAHPDWLLLAGLLHDIGKGQNGPHSSTGADLAAESLDAGGIEQHAGETISFLVKHHLILSHIATRRDLNDTRVIDELASLVGDGDRLRMLFLLTMTDALATGPNVWNRWKSALVQELFFKTLARLDGKESLDDSIQVNLEEKHFELLGSERDVEVFFWPESGELAVVAPDRPGLFNRIAGVLSLSHLNVLASRIYTTDNRRALEVFKVAASFESTISEKTIDRVRQEIIGSLSGQMALSYRMDKLSRRYKNQVVAPVPTRVVIENDSSDDHTIIEVYAMDEIGLLYKITSALFELNLDIHLAKVSTFGTEAIDVFYVSDLKGRKIISEDDLGEIEKNILFALSK